LAPQTQPARRTVRIERSFNASIQDVWELWTTKAGIESWWGPEGFEVKVDKLDFRPGGQLLYAMTATAPDQIEFLKKAGMPQTQAARITFNDVVPLKRLVFTQLADFIPNVAPYEVATTVEFDTGPEGLPIGMVDENMYVGQYERLGD